MTETAQGELFGIEAALPRVETPAARANDPESSHDAEDFINDTSLRAEQQQRCYAAVRAHPGLTSFELAMRTDIDRFELGRRLPEVRTSGRIHNPTDPATGRPATRACAVTGRKAMTWEPTEPMAAG